MWIRLDVSHPDLANVHQSETGEAGRRRHQVPSESGGYFQPFQQSERRWLFAVLSADVLAVRAALKCYQLHCCGFISGTNLHFAH